TPSLMKQLATLGMTIQQIPANTLTVSAGDDVASSVFAGAARPPVAARLSPVFIGTIYDAWADFSAAPDVPFRFYCRSGAAEQVTPFEPTSYTGAANVADILADIAKRCGWGFENNGVSVILSKPYFWGSAIQRVRRIAEAARINASL